MVEQGVPSESLLVYVAKIIIFAIIMFVAILGVDAFVLWLFKLLWNVDIWLTLLFLEGLVMAFFGVGSGTGQRDRPVYVYSPMGKLLAKVEVKFKYPWFWVSVGMTGVALWVLAAYLFLHVKV